MKTYTLKDYQAIFFTNDHPDGGFSFSEGICNCVRILPLLFTKSELEYSWRAYENCLACLGYGKQPIPLSEVNK